MKKDKIIEYIFIITLCFMFFFDLFVSNIFKNKIILATFLCIYVIICRIFMKTRKVDNVNKKMIIFLMTMFAIIYIVILYVAGIFLGFYKNSTPFSIKGIYTRILPATTIIICSEIIRNIFLARKNRKSTTFMTIALVLIDITTSIYLYNLSVLEDVLALIGYVGLSSISINLLGNYIASKYGIIPNIVYRVITTIYIYIFPIRPDIYLFFQAVFRMIYPYIIYLVIDNLVATDNFKVAVKKEKESLTASIIGILILISIVLLISCKFKYGMLVVGSSSMSGSINKGDAVIFEQYKKQKLEEGQVIIFNKDNQRIIHRIQDVQVLNGETIYYTKGDNNQQPDEGYRKDKDIIGVVELKLMYLGWPTLWVNDLFNK